MNLRKGIILMIIITPLVASTLMGANSNVNHINNRRAEKLNIKGDLISLLQSRMDKCTTEQFWAVGVITALSAFLIKISQNAINQKRLLPNYFVIAAQLILTAYGIYFVVHRHISFYKLEAELSCLLKDEEIAPKELKQKHNPWRGHALSGVVFYTGWILLACVAVVSCYPVQRINDWIHRVLNKLKHFLSGSCSGVG